MTVITFDEFIFLVKNLKRILSEVYEAEAQTNDANDWCFVQDPESQESVYLNKRTGETLKHKPKTFHASRIEALEFEYFVLDDGTEISIYTGDDGIRMYMDWDKGEWTKVPDEWNAMIDDQEEAFEDDTVTVTKPGVLRRQNTVAGTKHNPLLVARQNASKKTAVRKKSSAESARDERMGVFEHHSKGVFHTFLFENQRNTRLFFDEVDGQWVRMPLSWERNIPEVQTMLEEIDASLPHWKNVNEQLLALRECNYEVTDAIAFGEINFGAYVGDKKDGNMSANLIRTARRRTTTVKSSALIGDEDDGLGKLSAKASKYIASLEKELADARKKLDGVEKEEEELRTHVTKMERRATQAQLINSSKEAAEKEEESRHRALAEKVNTQRLRISDLEKQLAESKLKAQPKTEDTEVANLRKQLAEKSKQIAALKAEAEKFDASQVSGLYKKCKELQRVKNELGSVQSQFNDLEDMFSKVTKISKSIGDSTEAQVKEIASKYRAEVVLRKQLYNKILEMKGNIRVFMRCRPDKSVPKDEVVMQFPSDVEVKVQSLKGDPTTMEFNKTYPPNATQAQIFTDTKPVVMSVVDGYNVCIMAYGQTGSGKTYTMMGPESDPGVNRRAIQELIGLVNKESETLDVSIHASMYEVYNECVYDLLDSDGRTKRDVKLGPNGVYVSGLTERPTRTTEDVVAVMHDGGKNRSMAATKMNSESSRSHLIFELRVTTFNKLSNVHSEAKLALVDLAGSERVGKSGVTGQQLAEAAAINKSLSALSQVFSALSRHSPHIPYRNSKLTHVLQEYLGGDAKCCVFVNVRPDRRNLSETLSTLNFGSNIASIELGEAKAHKGKLPPPVKIGMTSSSKV